MQGQIYIQVDYQEMHKYFETRLCPYNLDAVEHTSEDYQREIEDEIELWPDRWIDWVMGDSCIDGTDGAYLYRYSATAICRLEDFDIQHRLIDEEANEVEAP